MIKQIVVPANAGFVDGVTAAARLLVVVFTFFVAALGFLKTKDVVGLLNLIQNNGGEALAAVTGLIALSTAAYGVIKSRLRGKQIASVAANPLVPEHIATTKA